MKITFFVPQTWSQLWSTRASKLIASLPGSFFSTSRKHCGCGWSRVCWKRCDWREGQESYSLSTLSSPTEANREWDLEKFPCRSAKSRSEGIVTFDIGDQCFQCSPPKRLAPHLAEFFTSTVGRSLEFVAWKKFGKELGTENHNNKWTAWWT